MGAMEASLRRALEAGDAADLGFRQSIYDASQRALERMILSRNLDEESADAQRNRLVETIVRIEGEYFAYYNDAQRAGAADPPAEENAHDLHGGDDPHDAAGDDPDGPGAPLSDAGVPPAGDDDPWTPGALRAARPPSFGGRHRRLIALAVGALALLAVVGLVAFTVLGRSDGSAGAPRPGTQAASVADPVWINAFTGSELEAVSTPNGGRIEAVGGEPSGRKAVRVASAAGTDGEIILSFGPGVVNELAGSRIRIELTAGSPDESPREFSVRCVFGGSSLCERQRFSTAMREEAFVFDVAVPADVGTPAGLAVGPGLGGEGPDLDIYSVRLRKIG